jgi:hypothetical protein
MLRSYVNERLTGISFRGDLKIDDGHSEPGSVKRQDNVSEKPPHAVEILSFSTGTFYGSHLCRNQKDDMKAICMRGVGESFSGGGAIDGRADALRRRR